MTSADASMAALGLGDDDEKKKRSISADASMRALGLEEGGIGKTILSAIPKGIANIAGTPAALDQLSKQATAWLASKMTGRSAEDIQAATGWIPGPMEAMLGKGASYTPETIRAGMERVTGPLYEPQNRTEKFADTATQMLIGLGRPNLKTAAMALTGAAGTEGAGAATEDNPFARFAGGLLGSAVPAMANSWRNAPAQAVKQAAGNPSEAQIAEAIAKQDAARNLGVPLMGAESMPASGLQQLAADVAASRQGAPAIRQMMEQRPDQVRQAAGGLLGQMGPQMTPEAAAGISQKAATDFMARLEGARTSAVNPLYQAAERQAVPQQGLDAIQASIAAQRAQYGLPAQQAALKAYETAMTRTPQTMGAYDKLYRSARDETTLDGIGASSKDKLAAKVLEPVKDELGAVTGANPNIAAGRELYREITERSISPMQAGPVGRIAGVKSGGFDPATTPPTARITAELSNTATVRPETIRETYQVLNAQDKRAFPAMARTYLENTFDQATQRVQAGDNRMMGANFAKAVVGTDQQRANFDEILRGVAQANGVKPDALIRGSKVLMETLESTGKVPGVGSPTAGRAELQQQLGKTIGGDVAGAVSTRPLGWLGRWWDDRAMGNRYAKLAEIMTAPDSVQQIAKMAKLKPDGMTARWYAAQLFGITRESTQAVP